MPRKSDQPLEKKTLNLFKGDAEALDAFFPRIGYSSVVRQITHKFVKQLQEKLNEKGAPNDTRELERTLAADIDRSVTEQLE